MARLLLLPLFLALGTLGCLAQDTTSHKFSIGIEQDFLPYATGGYFVGLWAGKKQVRVRALVAHVHKPGFIVQKGFANNRVTAYALLGDCFLKENWRGWWVGAGPVYWKNSIQTTERAGTAQYDNLLLNGSLGYNWKLTRRFYIAPWAGMHLRIAGARQVTLEGKALTPPLFNPEASVKLGWYFQP